MRRLVLIHGKKLPSQLLEFIAFGGGNSLRRELVTVMRPALADPLPAICCLGALETTPMACSVIAWQEAADLRVACEQFRMALQAAPVALAFQAIHLGAACLDPLTLEVAVETIDIPELRRTGALRDHSPKPWRQFLVFHGKSMEPLVVRENGCRTSPHEADETYPEWVLASLAQAHAPGAPGRKANRSSNSAEQPLDAAESEALKAAFWITRSMNVPERMVMRICCRTTSAAEATGPAKPTPAGRKRAAA